MHEQERAKNIRVGRVLDFVCFATRRTQESARAANRVKPCCAATVECLLNGSRQEGLHGQMALDYVEGDRRVLVHGHVRVVRCPSLDHMLRGWVRGHCAPERAGWAHSLVVVVALGTRPGRAAT